MGNDTIPATTFTATAPDDSLAGGVSEVRLAHLVSVLSGCKFTDALEVVHHECEPDPLRTVARSLCATLPRRRRALSHAA